MRPVKRLGIAFTLLVALSLVAVAQAEVVQEFGFENQGREDGRPLHTGL